MGGQGRKCGRDLSKLLAILLPGLCVTPWVPEEVPAAMDTLQKEVIPGALKWKNPQETEYA